MRGHLKTRELPRYGISWNGPQQPISVPMDEGYWTPAHIAQAELAKQARLIAWLSGLVEQMRNREDPSL